MNSTETYEELCDSLFVAQKQRDHPRMSSIIARMFQAYSKERLYDRTKFRNDLFMIMMELIEWYAINKHKSLIFTRESAYREIHHILTGLHEFYYCGNRTAPFNCPMYQYLDNMRIVKTLDESNTPGREAWVFPRRLIGIYPPREYILEEMSPDIQSFILRDKAAELIYT